MLADAQARAAATVNAANARAEATVRDATARAEAILTSAQQRAARLDEHTGRRVTYLTDTHAEVMRPLNEISTVLGDLLHGALTSLDADDVDSPRDAFDRMVAADIHFAPVLRHGRVVGTVSRKSALRSTILSSSPRSSHTPRQVGQ